MEYRKPINKDSFKDDLSTDSESVSYIDLDLVNEVLDDERAELTEENTPVKKSVPHSYGPSSIWELFPGPQKTIDRVLTVLLIATLVLFLGVGAFLVYSLRTNPLDAGEEETSVAEETSEEITEEESENATVATEATKAPSSDEVTKSAKETTASTETEADTSAKAEETTGEELTTDSETETTAEEETTSEPGSEEVTTTAEEITTTVAETTLAEETETEADTTPAANE